MGVGDFNFVLSFLLIVILWLPNPVVILTHYVLSLYLVMYALRFLTNFVVSRTHVGDRCVGDGSKVGGGMKTYTLVEVAICHHI